jgi:hypothetical protein
MTTYYTYSWTGDDGAGAGDWSDPLNWSGFDPPPDGSNAIVDIGTPPVGINAYDVGIQTGESFQVASLTIAYEYDTLTLVGTAALTVKGALTNSGELSFDESADNDGGSLSIGGRLINHRDVFVGDNDLTSPVTLTLGGLVNGALGDFEVEGSAGTPVTLSFIAGGTGFTSNQGFVDLSYVLPLTLNSDFKNVGVFELNGTSALTVAGDFANSGTVSVDSGLTPGGGAMTIGGKLTNTGTFQVGNGGLGASAILTLGGLTNSAKGDFAVEGSASHPATLVFSAGGTGFTANNGKVYLLNMTPLTLDKGFTNNGNFTPDGTSALTVSGGFNNHGSGSLLTLDGTSALTVKRGLTNDGMIYVDSNASNGLTIGGTLTNNDFITTGDSTGSAATSVIVGGLANGAGAIFDIYASTTRATTLKVHGLASNAGTFTLNSDTVLDLTGAGGFTQTATGSFFEAATATLDISKGDTATVNGTTVLDGKVAGAGTLSVVGGSANLGLGATMTVADWSVSGAGTTATLFENMNYAGTFQAGTGATLDLSTGNLTLTGTDTLADAATSGSYRLNAKGTTTVSGLTLGGTTTFEDEGVLTQRGGDVTLGGYPTNLLIAPTGSYDIQDDSGIALGLLPSSSVSDAGLFEKTGGAGISAIAPEFANSGKVLVSSGTLDFRNAMTGTGTDTIESASSLEFDSSVAGGQTIGFNGGDLVLNDPSGFAGKISNFAAGDEVGLLGDWSFVKFHENSGGTLGTLTLSSGGVQHAFNFVGDYTRADFHIASGTTTFVTHA